MTRNQTLAKTYTLTLKTSSTSTVRKGLSAKVEAVKICSYGKMNLCLQSKRVINWPPLQAQAMCQNCRCPWASHLASSSFTWITSSSSRQRPTMHKATQHARGVTTIKPLSCTARPWRFIHFTSRPCSIEDLHTTSWANSTMQLLTTQQLYRSIQKTLIPTIIKESPWIDEATTNRPSSASRQPFRSSPGKLIFITTEALHSANCAISSQPSQIIQRR